MQMKSAISILQIAQESLLNNEPINRANGKLEQADLERQSIEDIDKALTVLHFIEDASTDRRSKDSVATENT
jgi:hypothetical protein